VAPIDGATALIGLIADPVAQARSPDLVNRALARRGRSGSIVLVPLHVDAAGLADCVAGLRRVQNFRGAIVSMPHKGAVVELLDVLTPTAALVGAVNLIRRDASGRLTGTMLDGDGFVDGLRAAGHRVEGADCLLVGAGGAAAAIAFALAARGCASLTLLNRTRTNAAALAERIRRQYPRLRVATEAPPGAHFDVAVNATSLGMGDADPLPLNKEVIARCALVAECVLAPATTRLLRAAKAQGCATHAGLAMLAAQVDRMLDFLEGA